MKNFWLLVGPIALTGCAMASDVMDTGNGTYMVSAHAAPIRGGAAGANQVAYDAARKYRSGKGGHAVVLEAGSRDVYQGSVGGSNGSFGGGVFAAGNTDLRFRCENGTQSSTGTD
ncbi:MULTISPECIES: hypothetical protein [Paraburkholderia]|uniref:Lipoprotein n=1 Tax=Paraburkholderia acidicola TaxID=1912599 RepID=A0ABV1LYI3_9BURK